MLLGNLKVTFKKRRFKNFEKVDKVKLPWLWFMTRNNQKLKITVVIKYEHFIFDCTSAMVVILDFGQS